MSKIKLDPKIKKVFVEAGKRGGEKTKERGSDYYSKIAKKSWESRLKKKGRKTVIAEMSKRTKDAIARKVKEKEQAARKKKSGIGSRIANFLQSGDLD